MSGTSHESSVLCSIAYVPHTVHASTGGGRGVHCCCSNMPWLTLLSVCVQDLSSSWLSPFQRQITCPAPCLQNSEVQRGPRAPHALQRRGGPTTGILQTVFVEVKHKQTNKGVCRQEALIAASAIRVMKPDGRTVC